MTVLIGDEPVNSGNTGWTKSDVLTALEKVFYELGWNSGTQKNGVPVCCKWPNWSSSTTDMGTHNGANDGCYNSNTAGNWKTCGGQLTQREAAYRYLYIRNDGTNAYLIKEKITIAGYPNTTTEVITSTHAIGLPDGQEVVWAPGETAGDATKDIGGLTHGQTYYLGFDSNYPVNQSTFKLYNSNADALAKNNPVDITSNPAYPYPLWTPEQSNPTINVNIGDRLYWVLDDTSGGQFYWMDMAEGGYVSDRSIHGNPFVNQYIAGTGITGNGIEGDPYYWNTYYWLQSEDEPFDPSKMAGIGYQGTYSYGYANDTHSNMKGTLILNADSSSYSYHYNDTGYWKYTVPASGGRSELKLRIYRDLSPSSGAARGKVSGITIHSTGEGWSNNEVFTIPASATGGADRGATDIVFGVNAGETSSGADDGTPSIHVTNLGAGQNMFQKHPNGDYGILRLENDDSKNFGVTYWSFSFRNDNYRMFINSGIGWNYLNRLGEHCPNDSSGPYYGKFHGEVGLDLGIDPWPTVASTSTNYGPKYFATTSTPTSYPLHIRYYKAQSPQDDNFAVIQFTQTINTEVRPFFTFSLHAGPNFGAGIYDLDDQFTGSFTQFVTYDSQNGSTGSVRGRWVQTEYIIPGYKGSGTNIQEEPAEDSSKAREGSYGWLRNSKGNSVIVPLTKYECNIDTANSTNETEVVTYFRDSAYDKIDQFAEDVEYIRFKKDGLVGMPSSSNYYKPIKGLPISNQLVPCPYYMPDDFVMLQVAVQPGQVEFRTGDQVDISSSEKYKVIIGDNQKDQNGLDDINNNTAIGMLFCARIT